MTSVIAKSGERMTIAVHASTPFGFSPGQILHFSKSLRNGKVALIRGMCDGLLWFSVFPNVEAACGREALDAPVDSASCRVKEEFIRQYGWVVDDQRNTHIVFDAEDEDATTTTAPSA